MDVILCHTTADFDTLGAAVGLAQMLPGARIVLTGGMHPGVKEFLSLHRDAYPLIERRSVVPQQIKALHLVDAQSRSRFGKAAEWLDLKHLQGIYIYDHHPSAPPLEVLPSVPLSVQVEAVGATTTLIVERLQRAQVTLKNWEATVMALGIHGDTGSLTFEYTTPRDALALAWLMEQGASMAAIGEYVEGSFAPQLQPLLSPALDRLKQETIHGLQLAWVLLSAPSFVPGLSTLASRLTDLTDSDVLLLGVQYPQNVGDRENRVVLIGRSRCGEVDLRSVLEPLGGGGHPRAATATYHLEPGESVEALFASTLEQIRQQIPLPPVARELMSSPVRTILPSTSIGEAQRILLRYGHSGLSVVDDRGDLVGIISRRDIDLALHHGFGHAPVKGYMTLTPKTITPDTPLPTIQHLMVTYDIGRLPVLEEGRLLGIVTRTDLLRRLHPPNRAEIPRDSGCNADRLCSPLPTPPLFTNPLALLSIQLVPALWDFLQRAAAAATERGWHLYLVGGAVRDAYLALGAAASQTVYHFQSPENSSQPPGDRLLLQDLDLVVDGCHPGQTCAPWTEAAGVELAQALLTQYPGARLDVHGRFQTAALLWHQDPELGSLWVDIATARTEFYPYPAANPEVEASSIRQDLYRRDFTINALALRLTPPHPGELLDFFGGLVDLGAKVVRVLHSNSFIEDPTRIYRAVRFAVRLGFILEPQTLASIHYAIESGVYDRIQDENAVAPALQTRLRAELQYLFEAPYWKKALQLLGTLKALRCIHRHLELTPDLWRQVRLADYCLRHLTVPKTEAPLSHWLLLVEVLLLHLNPQETHSVALKLQLPLDSIERLRRFPQVQQDLQQHLKERLKQHLKERLKQHLKEPPIAAELPVSSSALKTDSRLSPSFLVQILKPYDVPTLILFLLQLDDRAGRRSLWRYLTQWRWVKPPLSGEDLKQLGYKPGKIFKIMLDGLLTAYLEGELGAGDPQDIRARAIEFVRTSF
jgi:tRNA nucleotidyltransferase (CCA-adding enzyme)